jgi:hypothetical protein
MAIYQHEKGSKKVEKHGLFCVARNLMKDADSGAALADGTTQTGANGSVR